MLTIWKYPLPVENALRVDMPKDARILSVQIQGGMPCLWALVNPDAEKERRMFSVLETGEPIESVEALTYIGTVQQSGGSYVFHLFEWKR